MRSLFLLSLLFIMAIAACAPAAATEGPLEVETSEQPTSAPETEEPTPEPVTIGPAEEAVIQQLAANLDFDESDISVFSSQEVEFGDACLDVAVEGMLCAQVVTPGRVIILEVDGVQYTYHTSEDGSRIQPATPALMWKREGGIAGFCDHLIVFRSGEVFTTKCNSQAEGVMSTFSNVLSSQEIAQFNDWVTEFAETDVDASDPKGVADGMVIRLKFFGTGDEPATEAEQQELLQFAQDTYTELAR